MIYLELELGKQIGKFDVGRLLSFDTSNWHLLKDKAFQKKVKGKPCVLYFNKYGTLLDYNDSVIRSLKDYVDFARSVGIKHIILNSPIIWIHYFMNKRVVTKRIKELLSRTNDIFKGTGISVIMLNPMKSARGPGKKKELVNPKNYIENLTYANTNPNELKEWNFFHLTTYNVEQFLKSYHALKSSLKKYGGENIVIEISSIRESTKKKILGGLLND